MEKSLARYIWNHTRRQQLFILLIVALSMIPYFLAFDLPKQIVNGPIQGEGFQSAGEKQLFMTIDFSLPYIGRIELFPGIELGRMQMLLGLSLMFLALVIVNGLFKFYINTYKGRLGERLLRRIRFGLIDRILRFPPLKFKRLKAGEISSMVKDEVEPLGGFTGDAFVQPALLGGQAITALTFIFLQHFWLGMIAAVMVGIQVGIIPRMRKRLIELGRERQVTARELAGRVGEIVEGIGTIHAYDTTNFERADMATRLGIIYKIRYDLYNWKFLVKFINNFLAQLTPFLFYCIGGYLTIEGRLDVGQLIAVINAYKELPGPMKELIDWDQVRQDVQVKYEQVVEQFDAENMIDAGVHSLDITSAGVMAAPLAVANLTLDDDSGGRLLERASLRINPGETIAFVGHASSGSEALAEAIGRMIWPTSGRIIAGETDIRDLPEAVTGRKISYVSSESYFFSGTVRDNLLYGLKHAPLTEVKYERAAAEHREWEIHEAKLAGNPDYDLNSDWIDYDCATAINGDKDILPSVLAVLDVVRLSTDALEFALHSIIDPDTDMDLAARIVDMRKALRDELEKQNLSSLVVPFEPGSYNTEAILGENLLFGTMTNPKVITRTIVKSDYFRKLMAETGLNRSLFDMGYSIAENTVELFQDLEPDHPFFQRLTYMSAEDIPEYAQMLKRLQKRGFDAATNDDRYSLIRLAFFYAEPRHRFGVLDQELMDRIVAARHQFHEGLPKELQSLIEPYDPEKYLASATLLDNILFGRINHRFSDASRQIRDIVAKLMQERELYPRVLAIGLEYHLGAGGRRLTSVQRMKLNLARALIRKSDYYILNRPLPGLDHNLQEKIVEDSLTFLRQNGHNPAIVWVLSNTSLAKHFDRVVAFDKGVIVEDSSYETFAGESAIYKELMAS